MLTWERHTEEHFHHAAHTYTQNHQACISCHQPHCVFFSAGASAEEYRCFHCGFCVCHDLQNDTYSAGHEKTQGVDVLADKEPALLDHLEDHPILRGS